MPDLADRGAPAEVAAHAKLDQAAAARFLERREANLAENAQRRERRDGCLRDSALTGAATGFGGASLAYRWLQNRSTSTRTWMGGGGQAFTVVFGFFMPFMFVSNVVRWRCQKKGLKPFKAPRQPAES